MSLTPEQMASRLAERNPFATRFVRPGAIPFQFDNDWTVTELIAALRTNAWRGEIVGPHGSGKSTLVQTLVPALQDAGRDVRQFTMRAGEARLPVSAADLKNWAPTTQLIIDGFEQLGGWTQTLIRRICNGNGCGLLVTSHQPTGLPLLIRTAPSLQVTQAIVRAIQLPEFIRVFDRDVELSFHRHRGNIREVFFELYGLFEQRQTLGE